MGFDVVLKDQRREQVHAEDGIDEHDEREQRAHVEHGWEREDDGRDEVTQPLDALEDAQDPHDPEQAEHAEQEWRHLMREAISMQSACNHAEHAEQEWRHRQVGRQVRREVVDECGADEHEVETVPADREVA